MKTLRAFACNQGAGLFVAPRLGATFVVALDVAFGDMVELDCLQPAKAAAARISRSIALFIVLTSFVGGLICKLAGVRN